VIVFASALSAPPPPPECPSVFERAAEAASTALLVASGAFGCSHVDDAHLRLSRLSQRVEIFQLRKKRWPTELSEVFGDEGVPLTPWGHAYVLAPALVVGGAPTLVDPGRDGVLAQGCGRREGRGPPVGVDNRGRLWPRGRRSTEPDGPAHRPVAPTAAFLSDPPGGANREADPSVRRLGRSRLRCPPGPELVPRPPREPALVRWVTATTRPTRVGSGHSWPLRRRKRTSGAASVRPSLTPSRGTPSSGRSPSCDPAQVQSP
jgi:hypothetical protein